MNHVIYTLLLYAHNIKRQEYIMFYSNKVNVVDALINMTNHLSCRDYSAEKNTRMMDE